MDCRLCLCSGPAESFVSIHGNSHPHLAQRISSCCQLQVKKDDRLPDKICRSCNNNLDLLISFRKVCHRSDEISKLKLNTCLNIKPEEVLLEDLIWENEFDVHSPLNVSNTPVNNVMSERESSTSEQTNSEPSIHSIGNIKPEEVLLEDLIWENESDANSLANANNTPVTDQMMRYLYKCDICFHTFTRKDSFTRHIKNHAGLKPYKCDICVKSYHLKAYLIRHIKTHAHTHTYKYHTNVENNSNKRVEIDKQDDEEMGKMVEEFCQSLKAKLLPNVPTSSLKIMLTNLKNINTPKQCYEWVEWINQRSTIS
ncbi:uncharacterized protein LOC143921496 [Arctopsyche grandis]|uniref:uncharacterized protein LOC143921496 n=1 Tax=Arctopsyche grandis TaxID=121162 RepID=UPI00406D8810